MHLRRLLIALGAIINWGCASKDAASGSNEANYQGLGDTEIVRTAGVPTAPDDTAPTRYNKHQTPRRLTAPDCRPQGIALCLRDTATTVISVDCCIANQRQTDWLVFAAAKDSMQFFLEPARDAYLTMSPPNAAGAGAETSRGVDGSWFRARFPVAGTYVLTADVESDSAVSYELRVAPVITTGASQPTGSAARITIAGESKAKIAIAPRSMLPEGDIGASGRYAVNPGIYRVLLVRDTVYTACALPCTHRTTFTLRPGQVASIAP